MDSQQGGRKLKALRIARAEAGLTMVELAQKSGVGRDTISRIERDKVEPLGPTLNKLARALGMTVEQLYAMEERHRPLAPRPELTLAYMSRVGSAQRRALLGASSDTEEREYVRAIDRALDSAARWGREEQDRDALDAYVEFLRRLRDETDPSDTQPPLPGLRGELVAEASLGIA